MLQPKTHMAGNGVDRAGKLLLKTCLGVSLAVLLGAAGAVRAAPGDDWASYGRDGTGTRFSPLSAITPDNVTKLTVAWTHHMKPPGAARVATSQTTPLVVNGIMYVGSPYGEILALDGATGEQLWAATLPGNDRPATRGIAYWAGDGKNWPELLFGTTSGKLVALDARSGALVEGFGDGGVVDLRTPDIMNGSTRRYAMTAAPAIYGNLAITGAAVPEDPRGPSGDVRAWDVRTGKLVWRFHAVPRPGEMGHDTWPADGWQNRSGVNVWNMMAVDEARGIVYLPFSAPASDRWGGDRIGKNLFGNALVAVDAATGKYLWHFQLLHHDIWDWDFGTPPVLLDVKKNGKTIPAVAAINKSAYLFLLDRVTGKPIYDVKETPVPPSTIPGEQAWPTQPVPVTPPPLARQSFTAATDVAKVTPEHEAFCKNLITTKKLQDSKPFSPLTMDSQIARFPGSGGGPEWGGAAFDPRLGYYIINTNDMGSIEQLRKRGDGIWESTTGPDSFFMDEDNKLMCQAPPWGSLYAVNVNTGKIAWRTTLGVTDSLPEAVRATGRPSLGGPIVTAGGLTFIGGTDDSRFRAFDTASGKELWTYKLDYSAHATPMTYRGRDGRQYVAIVATGGSFLRSPAGGDSILVFALPEQ